MTEASGHCEGLSGRQADQVPIFFLMTVFKKKGGNTGPSLATRVISNVLRLSTLSIRPIGL